MIDKELAREAMLKSGLNWFDSSASVTLLSGNIFDEASSDGQIPDGVSVLHEMARELNQGEFVYLSYQQVNHLPIIQLERLVEGLFYHESSRPRYVFIGGVHPLGKRGLWAFLDKLQTLSESFGCQFFMPIIEKPRRWWMVIRDTILYGDGSYRILVVDRKDITKMSLIFAPVQDGVDRPYGDNPNLHSAWRLNEGEYRVDRWEDGDSQKIVLVNDDTQVELEVDAIPSNATWINTYPIHVGFDGLSFNELPSNQVIPLLHDSRPYIRFHTALLLQRMIRMRKHYDKPKSGDDAEKGSKIDETFTAIVSHFPEPSTIADPVLKSIWENVVTQVKSRYGKEFLGKRE